MSEYVYLYRTTNEASQAAMGSPERMQQSMQAWMAWMKQLADQGHLKNQGHPLERTGRTVTGKKKTVTDGANAETKDIIGGFSIGEAKGIGEAGRLSLGCPIFEGGGVVEVRPVRKLDM